MKLHIDQLSTVNFRNLSSLTLQPNARFNIIYGDNGAGKTTILEAIYYLSRGKSFRSQQAKTIIQQDQPQLSVFARLTRNQQQMALGIERQSNGQRRIHIDKQPQQTAATLTERLPIQFLSAQSARYFYDGPKARRKLLDWGVFHVEPGFYQAWQNMQQCIKQRNALLKIKASQLELAVWDQQLTKLAEVINEQRLRYIECLTPLLRQYIEQLLRQRLPISIQFQQGWPKQSNLLDALNAHLPRDLITGYTSVGPHKADLQLVLDKRIPAKDFLSQGQQKLAVYALSLAQSLLLQQQLGQTPIYLLDDLSAELDQQHANNVLTCLKELAGQVFITAIDAAPLQEALANTTHQLFHVKHGNVTATPFEQTKRANYEEKTTVN